MKPLPASKEEFLSEIETLQTLDPNAEPTPRAKLYHHMISSHKINRSFQHTSILLIGSSGVGKSETVNHLLDTGDDIPLAKTSSSESETRMTSEFVSTVDDPKYEVSDLTFGIVDTPGFNDTNGTAQDACNLYSIKKFYETHPKLNGCYPNLIFVVAKATETRIKGTNSNFAKSLRCLKYLDLVDERNPNVVAILTFACSVSYKKVTKWKEKMEEKKSITREILSKILHVDVPVILIENLFDDEELEKDGEFTVLPNGERQPKNLYEACLKLLYDNKDNFGLMTLNACFTKPKKKRPTDGHKIVAKDASKERLSAEENGISAMLTGAAQSGAEDPITDRTLQYIEEQKLNEKQKDEMMKLTKTMKRMGLENDDDFSSVSVQDVNFFHGSDISDNGVEMLEKKFRITKQTVSLGEDDLVGRGYNIIIDKPVAVQIIQFETVNNDKFGFEVPTCAKVVKVNETHVFQEEFKDEKSYIKSRLRNLGVNIDVLHSIFKMAPRVGFNARWKNDSSDRSSSSGHSFLYEHRMVQIRIANFQEKGISFTQDFHSAVKELPDKYGNSDDERKEFKMFFERFGHFIVTSAYGGGAVELRTTDQSRDPSEKTELSLEGSATAGARGFGGELRGEWESSSDDNSKALLNQCSIRWHGGRADLHKNETFDSPEKMDKWRASLLSKPSLLTTEMGLEPISTVIGVVDKSKERSCRDALEDLLNGKFKNAVAAKTQRKEGEDDRKDDKEQERKAKTEKKGERDKKDDKEQERKEKTERKEGGDDKKDDNEQERKAKRERKEGGDHKKDGKEHKREEDNTREGSVKDPDESGWFGSIMTLKNVFGAAIIGGIAGIIGLAYKHRHWLLQSVIHIIKRT